MKSVSGNIWKSSKAFEAEYAAYLGERLKRCHAAGVTGAKPVGIYDLQLMM